MRDLQQCQAEVFRRSEKRIQQNKKRTKHILLTCVPLVLCLAVCCTVMWPGVPSGDMCAPECAPEMPISTEPAMGAPSTVVTVNYGELSLCYTDSNQTLQICELLEQPLNRYEENREEVNYGVPEDILTNATDGLASVKIVVQTPQGTQTEYLLCGNVLQNVTKGEERTLTQAQAEALKKSLGIYAQ